MWLKCNDFYKIVATNWSLSQDGYEMYKFVSKLKWLKQVLRKWNNVSFGNVF